MGRKPMGWGARLLIVTAAALLAAFALMTREAKAPVEEDYAVRKASPPPVSSASETEERIASDCEIIQTMGFSRCGHSVTRRIDAPENVAGMNFSRAQEYYSLWQIEEFSRDRVVMRREIPLYCPVHEVLSVNEAGEVALCRNVYGDGMAVTKTYGRQLADFDGDIQAALLTGMGFDSQEEAEAWLAVH